MALSNTAETYGSVERTLHWLTALFILTAIPLGLIANDMPYDTGEALAAKAQLFSVHKSVGIAAFAVALIRIVWALIQPRPASLHPPRGAQHLLAGLVHWSLYISLVAVPLTGWVTHAAAAGFAPILWPFGQTLPFVPQSETVAHMAGLLHWCFTKILIVSILLHVAGALKHHFLDRDDTLRRMVSGRTGPVAPAARRRSQGPMLAALAIYGAGAGVAWSLLPPGPDAITPQATVAAAPAVETPAGWQVEDGTLAIAVRQMGQEVGGSFADWSAAIRFDETPVEGVNGDVTVTIAMNSVSLGSVTSQATTPEFFDTAAHPTATFTATIRPDGAGYIADGTLTLRGTAVPVALPFTLVLEGDTARMQGSVALDRRAFGIGPSYPDEASVGFEVVVTVDLTARRPG